MIRISLLEITTESDSFSEMEYPGKFSLQIYYTFEERRELWDLCIWKLNEKYSKICRDIVK